MIRMVTEKSHVIGQGTYGCALRPKAPCKKSKIRRTVKKVGKIVRANNAQIELRIGTLIKSIQGWEKYYVVQEEDDCDAENIKKIRVDYGSDCKLFAKTPTDKLTQIVSDYGGKPLSASHPMSGFDYMDSFKHLLEGISLLQGQGICHHDLKDNNIVVDEKGVLRIIDFGAAFLGDHIHVDGQRSLGTKMHIFDFYPDYNTFSPDYTVLCGLKKVFDNKGQEEFHRSLREQCNSTVEEKDVFSYMETLLGMHRSICKRELLDFWNYSFNDWENRDDLHENKWENFFHKYWRSWDTWAVGVIYLKLLKNLLLHQSFLANTWNPHGAVIKKVLHGLLEVDPRRRLSAKAALRMFAV